MDRIHILNSIRDRTGDAINDSPPATDDTYTAVENALRTTFTSFEATLPAASKEDDTVWGEFLTAISKGEKEPTMRFDSD